MLFIKAIVMIFCIVALFQPTQAFAADTTDSRRSTLEKLIGTLHLVGGDVYRGEIATTAGEASMGALVWRCPSFSTNLIVPWNAVERLSQPISDPTPDADGPQSKTSQDFVFELQTGECISGNLTNMTEQLIEVDCPLTGKKQLPIESIRSVLRSKPTAIAHGGTLAIADWKQVTPPSKIGGRSKWFEHTGSYETEASGTEITQLVSIPDLVAIDIEVAWEHARPNWVLTLGDRRLEVHFRKHSDRNLISITIAVTDDSEAEIATAQIPSDGLNSIALRILCDSIRGRLVLLQSDIPIAQLRLKKSMRLTGKHNLTFTNVEAGRISLREVKVYPSIFTTPFLKPNVDQDANTPDMQIETLLQSGETIVGRPNRFDAAAQTFGFADDNTEQRRTSLSQVERMEFPPHESDRTTSVSRPLYVLELKSGARYIGQTVTMESGQVNLSIDSLKSTVNIPIKELNSIGLNVQRSSKPKGDDNVESDKLMKLITPWATSTGTIDRVTPLLSQGNEADARPKLFWKALVANSIVLAENASGVIEPISFLGNKAISKTTVGSPYIVARTGTKKVEPDYGFPLRPDEPSLFLKSGDCFPAVVEGINESTTIFKSDIFESDKIDNEFIRGIRILAYTGTDTFEKGVRKKLLTLPRSQRNNPPSHLIVSREGDAIRGQLKGLTTDIATIEVRGSDRSIMMKTVAEIIWLLDAPEIVPLHKDGPSKLDNENEIKSEIEPTTGELACQALFSSGTRISVIPERFEQGVLFGKHPQLGKCQIDLSKVSRLVLGQAITDEAQRNRFEKWKLENAPDPKFVNDLDSQDEAGNADSKSDSAHTKMIGQAAPQFELNKLEGTTMRLSDLRGKIVVLDFWATWCGPCMISLPKMLEIGREYKGSGVEFVAINIEQKQAEIQTALNRLEINPTVALDSDGAIARAYHANAIPQTVIIDRMGNISQILVGGGEASEKKLRDALDVLLNAKF